MTRVGQSRMQPGRHRAPTWPMNVASTNATMSVESARNTIAVSTFNRSRARMLHTRGRPNANATPDQSTIRLRSANHADQIMERDTSCNPRTVSPKSENGVFRVHTTITRVVIICTINTPFFGKLFTACTSQPGDDVRTIQLAFAAWRQGLWAADQLVNYKHERRAEQIQREPNAVSHCRHCRK